MNKELQALSEKMEQLNYSRFTDLIACVRVAGEAVYGIDKQDKELYRDFNVDCYVAIKHCAESLDKLLAEYEALQIDLKHIAEQGLKAG